MNYALITYGSMGDVRPFIALALGLQKSGHRVTLAAPENFKTFAEYLGIPFHPLPGDMEQRVHTPEVLKLVKTEDNLLFLIRLLKTSDDLRPPLLQNMLDIGRIADVLITSTLGIFFVDAVAEHLHKKWAMLLPSPPMVETSAYPFPDFDFLNFPSWNRFTYRLVTFAFWQVYKKRVRETRAKLGLPFKKTNPLRQYEKGKIPTLFLFSQELILQPADWPDSCRITGYLTLDEPQPPDLRTQAWLRAGTPPIYLGFGSIPIPNPRLITTVVEAILAQTTHRIIFCKGWSNLPQLPEHPNLIVIDRADHRWLLPQCATAIHHGGAGTTGATLAAGIPSIVLSLFGDQAQWGKIVQRRGVGVHLPFKRLTPTRLLNAIQKATSTPIAQKTRDIGTRVAAEDGVARAIESLSTFFN